MESVSIPCFAMLSRCVALRNHAVAMQSLTLPDFAFAIRINAILDFAFAVSYQANQCGTLPPHSVQCRAAPLHYFATLHRAIAAQCMPSYAYPLRLTTKQLSSRPCFAGPSFALAMPVPVFHDRAVAIRRDPIRSHPLPPHCTSSRYISVANLRMANHCFAFALLQNSTQGPCRALPFGAIPNRAFAVPFKAHRCQRFSSRCNAVGSRCSSNLCRCCSTLCSPPPKQLCAAQR